MWSVFLCCPLQFIMLTYIFMLAWLGVTAFTSLPVFIYFNIWNICQNATVLEGATLCLDPRQYGKDGLNFFNPHFSDLNCLDLYGIHCWTPFTSMLCCLTYWKWAECNIYLTNMACNRKYNHCTGTNMIMFTVHFWQMHALKQPLWKQSAVNVKVMFLIYDLMFLFKWLSW